MKVEDAFTGGAAYTVNSVITSIATRAETLYNNLRTAAQESGIDVTNIDNPGKLAQVYAQEGPKSIADLLGAVILAKVLVIREIGRYAGGDGFAEVLEEEFQDFPGSPTLTDIDTFLQDIEGGSAATTEAARELVESTTEAEGAEEEAGGAEAESPEAEEEAEGGEE